MIGAFRASRQRNVTQDQIHIVHESPIHTYILSTLFPRT